MSRRRTETGGAGFAGPGPVVLITALSLLPALAWAGNTQLPVHGVRDLGVGGASTASTEGADALWHNPARLGRSTVGLSLAFVDLQASYTSGTERVENAGQPLPNPSLGAVWRINDLFSVGAGAYAPFGGQYSFPEAGPQRYSLIENDKSTVLFMNLAAAVRIGDLSVGAGFQAVTAHVRQRSMLSGYTGLFGHEKDPELDVLSEIDLKDGFTPTGNLGLAYDLGRFSFAASAQLPYTISGDATMRNRLGTSVFFDGMTIEGDVATLEIPHPWIVRGGVAWRPTDRVSIEAGVKWENWSVQQELVLDPKGRIVLHGVPGIGDYNMKKIVIERRLRDTLSAHLGADVEILERLHVRGGAFFEQSAYPDQTFSVAVFDDDKLGASLGLSWQYSQFRFDVAVARIFSGTRNIGNSELRQVNPTNPEQAEVVGNGSYDSGFWVGGGAVAWIYE